MFNGKEYVEKQSHDYTELREIISILRSPEGCPWDREQTHESLKKCLADETEEVLAAIDNKDDRNLNTFIAFQSDVPEYCPSHQPPDEFHKDGLPAK